MAMKVIGVYLMLSYLFLHNDVSGFIQITEQQYAAFNGVDPTTSCKCNNTMIAICNMLGKRPGFTDGQKCQVAGFPSCMDSYVILQKTCGGGTFKKQIKILMCSWTPGKTFILGKGQSPNHVMNYGINKDRDLEGLADILYKAC